jgi:hypothetical protein
MINFTIFLNEKNCKISNVNHDLIEFSKNTYVCIDPVVNDVKMSKNLRKFSKISQIQKDS